MVLMLTNKLRICAINVNLHHGISPSVEFKGERINQLKLIYMQSFIATVYCYAPSTTTYLESWFGIKVDEYYKKDRNFILGYYQDNKSFNNKSYKILMSFIPGSNDSEIYEFNSDSWRILDEDIPSSSFIGYCGQSFSLKGNTYSFSINTTIPYLGLSLLKFDISTEKYGDVPLPYDHSCCYETANLSVVREEKLSVLLQRKSTTTTEIWVTNKIGDETKVVVSWSKVLALDLSSDVHFSIFGSFLLDEEKKFIVCCDRWIRYMYMDMEEEMADGIDKIYIVGEDSKVTQEKFREVSYKIDGTWPSILNYAPSLVQIQRPGGKRKRRGD